MATGNVPVAEDGALKTYVVGGAVRDALLGLPVQDQDHVVVGATPEEMGALGFRPVGSDFPVFLHPRTHEEYALARTERKTAPGYKGFAFHASPEVTLEEDLRRRDLTINAMARAEDGSLVDPHDGQSDLKAGILRHVSEAFAEDPVRILRVARFAARFGFAVAPETRELMRRMVDSGEVDALVPERVWQELSRGLMEASPSQMLAVLRDCGALERVLPEVACTRDVARLDARLDFSAREASALPVRYALLALDVEPASISALSARINAPSECRELALLARRERDLLHRATALDAGEMLGLLERADAFRRPERLDALLQVAQCDAGAPRGAYAPRVAIERAHGIAKSVDAGRIAAENPQAIPASIRAARLAALAAGTR